mmetsp:Transcript_15256/g.32071  ORF Transcript_15256/g.32071 Transcript_15256/m.32071 type:complete len:221 (-) Transcript_15256:920-1582(-)
MAPSPCSRVWMLRLGLGNMWEQLPPWQQRQPRRQRLTPRGEASPPLAASVQASKRSCGGSFGRRQVRSHRPSLSPCPGKRRSSGAYVSASVRVIFAFSGPPTSRWRASEEVRSPAAVRWCRWGLGSSPASGITCVRATSASFAPPTFWSCTTTAAESSAVRTCRSAPSGSLLRHSPSWPSPTTSAATRRRSPQVGIATATTSTMRCHASHPFFLPSPTGG